MNGHVQVQASLNKQIHYYFLSCGMIMDNNIIQFKLNRDQYAKIIMPPIFMFTLLLISTHYHQLIMPLGIIHQYHISIQVKRVLIFQFSHSQHYYNQHITYIFHIFTYTGVMNMTKTYLFFDSKSKKPKKTQQTIGNTHSRSLSAKSDLTKNSARTKTIIQKPQGLPLTKKQKQIRQAIEYRYRKSKMKEYTLSYQYNQKAANFKARESTISRSNSSQMQQYRQLKTLKIINLKQHHDRIYKQKLEEKEKNSVKSKLRIRTDSSLIIKTQGSQKSMEKLKFLKPYIQSQLTPTKLHSKLKANPSGKMGNNLVHSSKQDWKFISIQGKDKDKFLKQKDKDSRSKNKQGKINSHRTLTVETSQKSHNNNSQHHRMKTTQSQWQIVPKLKDLGKLNKKYRF